MVKKSIQKTGPTSPMVGDCIQQTSITSPLLTDSLKETEITPPIPKYFFKETGSLSLYQKGKKTFIDDEIDSSADTDSEKTKRSTLATSKEDTSDLLNKSSPTHHDTVDTSTDDTNFQYVTEHLVGH